ncbi:MAG: outer membrane lipoprotein carrier protein LolA [Bacteroidota bacterium]
MRLLLLLSFMTLLSISLTAQKNTLSSAADSDPQATALLKKVQAKYESFTTVGMDFSLIIQIPEAQEEVQKGTLYQKGENYKLEMKDQLVFFDGKTMWLYLKGMNEVQIMDAQEMPEGMLSPKDLLRIYEQKDFVYALTTRTKIGNRLVEQIEFKPLKKNVDYSKMRVSVEKGTHEIVQIEAFSKDGSRYILRVDDLKPNVALADATFKFNKQDYPDVYVEDLRY